MPRSPFDRNGALWLLAVAVGVILLLLPVYLLGGFRGYPDYTNYCDAASLQDGAANRLYVTTTGSIAVAPRDPSC